MRTTSLFVFVSLVAVALAPSACARTSLPPPRTEAGRATPIAAPPPLPSDHPAIEGAEAVSTDDHAGRAPRRLGVDQLRAALLAATGFTWVASRRVSDPESPAGVSNVPDADMLEALAPTLGKADYATTTSESLDPAVTYAKLEGDAARAACRASVRFDVGAPPDARRILRFVAPSDTLATNAKAVRKNLVYLALRFWGRQAREDDAQIDALATLFDRATRASTPADGWRAVCIAMASDPQFSTY